MDSKWFVLLFNTAFFILMAWLLPIHYEENDDVVMCMIANGVFSGNPDGHLVFVNAIYGWILAGLYMITKAVEWYTLSFCVLHVLAMTGVVYVVARDKGLHPLLKGAFLVFIYVIWARIIIAFQFTTTAGLLCFSGCLAMLQHSKKWRIAGVGAVFVASLIRFSAAGLVGLLCVPLFVSEFAREKRFAFWVLGVAFLALFGFLMNGLFYQQEDWAEYKAYNAVRGRIHDNPNAILLSESDLPEGVTMDDYQLFCGFVGDPKIMDLQKLQIVESRIKKSISITDAMKNLSHLSLYRVPLALLCFGFVFCLVMNVKRKNKNGVFSLIVIFADFVIVLVYLGIFATLKNRVFLCMLFPMTYQMLKAFPRADYQKGERTAFIIISAIMVALVAKYVYQNYKVVKLVQIRQKEFDAFQNPLIQDKEDVLFLSSFYLEYMHPFSIKDYKFRIIGLGWLTNIPLQKGLLESHADLVDSNSLCFCGVDCPPVNLMKAIKRNYGVDTEPIPIAYNEKYALYSLKSRVVK